MLVVSRSITLSCCALVRSSKCGIDDLVVRHDQSARGRDLGSKLCPDGTIANRKAPVVEDEKIIPQLLHQQRTSAPSLGREVHEQGRPVIRDQTELEVLLG